jgi:gliding-associated putative ABC transporter substrate-binding component GldG
MSRSKTLDTTVFTLAVIGIVVLLNVLAVGAFWRVDLTGDHRFTLSEASRDAVRSLDDHLTVKAYFSDGLPAPYSQNARYVRDLLEEYYSASDGHLSYEFLDPMAEETQEDKDKRKDVQRDIFGRALRQETDMERELRSLGIQPVEVRVNEGDSLEVKRVYMGISVRYGDQQEAIPVVADTSSLEYDLTTLIRRVSRTKVPTIGIVTGRDGLDLNQDLGKVVSLLSQQYEVRPLDLEADASIPDDVDALIVTGPKEPFTPAETAAIDAFLRRGGHAAFFPDAVKVDLRTMESDVVDSGLGDLLASYGVTIKPGLLLDAECAQINVTQQRGFMRVAQPVRYPFLPAIRQLDQEHPLTRGLSDITFPFVSALEPGTPSVGPLDVEVLVSSSDSAWIQEPPYDLNPLQQWPDTIQFSGPYPIVVTVSGDLPGTATTADDDAGSAPAPAAKVPVRLLVVGGSALLQDQFLSNSSQALVLNLVDWLVLDDAMLAIRSRGLADVPLEELNDGAKKLVKYGNVIGVPLLFVVLGIVRWRLRERRRRLVTV